MKRTITIENACVYYKKRQIDYLVRDIREYFELEDSRVYSSFYKYVIDIKEGGDFKFKEKNNFYKKQKNEFYNISKNSEHIGIICIEKFNKLFFTPVKNQGYSIIITKKKVKVPVV